MERIFVQVERSHPVHYSSMVPQARAYRRSMLISQPAGFTMGLETSEIPCGAGGIL
jgi:hypothetical protein